MSPESAGGNHDFTGILNVPGIQAVPGDDEGTKKDLGLEPEPEATPEPGSSEDAPRNPTTIELEYIQMLRAQKGCATEQGVAFMQLADLLEQLTGLAEQDRVEKADQAEERLSLEERRRWHAAGSLLQGSGVGWSFELLDDVTRWLKTGEKPLDKR